ATVPLRSSSVERQAVVDALSAAGARGATLVEAPKAAAIGAGINVHSPHGTLIVHIGGGTTEAAVIALGRIVVSQACVGAGEQMDEAVLRWIRDDYNLAISPASAEMVKIQIGSAWPMEELARRDDLKVDVFGRDVVTNL